MEYNQISIVIDDCNTPAMKEDASAQVIKELEGAIASIKEYGLAYQDGTYLRDRDGNTIGHIEVDWSEDSEEDD